MQPVSSALLVRRVTVQVNRRSWELGMKFFPIIWAGLWRRPVRTLFTTASVLIAFLLFGLLFGITAGFDAAIGKISPNGMRVQARSSLRDVLPESYLRQLERVPGVKSAVPLAYLFDARFQGSKAPLPLFAVGGENPFQALPPEFKLALEQQAALLRTRTGAIVGARLAEKFGWKIGDRLPLTSSVFTRRDGSPLWLFDIVGIYEMEGKPGLANEVFFNYSYLEETRAVGKGFVTMFMLRITDPSRSADIARSIDDMFANSSYPTSTQNDRDWIRARVDRLGNIEFFVIAVVGAALFTLLFLTGNTMAQSVMERIPELAVLKAIGFSDLRVFALVLLEAVLLCAIGAFAGLGITAVLFPALAATLSLPIGMPWQSVAMGAGIALAVAVLSSIWPALRAKRLSVIDGLAGR
jgi:putative ABC transport system permease protein